MAQEHVLLVHGLAESSLWMYGIECALRMGGYETHVMDYPSTRMSVEELTNIYLADAIALYADAPQLHFVTHSMGGVMLHHYLQTRTIPNQGRIVMLSPAHQGSPTLRVLSHFPLYPVIMGPAGVQSVDDDRSFARQLPSATDHDVGIIAGCLSLDPVSWLTMPWPNDGKTTVDGTKLHGMTDHIVVPASHDTMLYDPVTLYQTNYFLRHGRFLKK